MAVSVEEIVDTNVQLNETLLALQKQYEAIRSQKIAVRKQQLRQENEQLRQRVEVAKQQLIDLERRNGKVQIPVPGASGRAATTPAPAPTTQHTATPAVAANQKPQKTKQPKEQAAKQPAPKAAAAAAAAADESPADIGRLDLRVGRIVEIQKHPDADALYLEKIDVGEAVPRTVVSGLVKFVPIEQMQNRLVIVFCNLKPAKMRGVLSEGMLMCASTPDKVEPIDPPATCVPGDLIHCDGYVRRPDAQLNPKKKIWESVAPDLKTDAEAIVSYKGQRLFVPDKGQLKSKSLAGVPVK